MEPAAVRCPICRSPRPEDAEYCAVCAAAMAGVETEDEADGETAAAGGPAGTPAVMEPEERRLRLCELALVVGTGFLWSTIVSLVDWWTGTERFTSGAMAEISRIVQAVISISVLAYVLNRQGRSLASIGLTARLTDLFWTLPLWFFSSVFNRTVAHLVYSSFPPKHLVFSVHPAHWASLLPSAAMEELIVRAFLISEVAELSGSMPLAVFVSVAFQTSYHLYQGTPAALVAAGMFFVSSVFYASTRRITPVILAHALHNVLVSFS